MKYILSKNIESIGFAMEGSKDEIKRFKNAKYLADKMVKAHDAANMIFEKFPEFKQVTLDTVTDEERDMIEQSKKSSKN